MPLFTPQDLVPLAKRNLGLRLTGNIKEANFGGFGDAIPLSHLGGAKDIIEFLTLAFFSDLPKDQMEVIYNRYKEIDIHSIDCMPRLILYYAAQNNIGDARERLSHKKDAPISKLYFKLKLASIEHEAKKLVSYYNANSMIAPLELIISQFPHIAQELAHNFNEKFFLRLKKNWNAYATSDDMDYLFLSDNFPHTHKYEVGYDFNNYPLGKVGRHHFEAVNVIRQIMFLGGENRSPDTEIHLEHRIYNSMKTILKDMVYTSLNQQQQNIEIKLSQHPEYPINFKKACNDIVMLVFKLQESEQLSSEESFDLLKRTGDLIDNPAEYKSFLKAANSYRMVSGGQLSAYMMLIAGWAAKIMTVNFIGDAWIKFATEKLDLISTSKELADLSHSCSIGL
ncbi:hypothetical protein [Legionella longbeachae]|uniref:Uncharacterized protein n=1 Tax=Legionella longbeachae serogroup 1 (strain NSW150) TaxID=661367 RepID=D3HSZ1_LEGLN|nr:hypothetical protein [Legionella longbeachae]VEE02522.1 Uncharacterised protein [Legionella oakridgensis]HBD7398782.1 hypothetical protein [Legionella pneumophila]ARB91206.1 hypothetical protein A6J40_02940 [Legionella longbeachae]ARM32369.1 hypothetical protein B0B39_01970 [Legionella longbeachae]EEZ94838.1 hypothetical protein LLB_3756 [Legionella longbeachae D-4968]